MPKRIDHEKRKVEMLYAALEVYATEGKNANLSLIASKCGLSRTTVYQYFKDESDLFHYAVKYTTDVAFGIYSSEQYEAVTDPVEKLYMITTDIMNRADTYERQIGNFVLTAEHLNSKDSDGTVLLNNFEITIHPGEKVAFVGMEHNSISSFFDIVSGTKKCEGATVNWGQTTKQTYMGRDNSSYFNNELTITDWLKQYSPDQDDAYVRGFLGRMLFTGDDSLKKVKVLSGGEKVRCMLSKMMLSGANVLILDDPTNHLDLESIESLNEGLVKFPGVVMFSSHDHEFISTIANRIIEITPKGIIDRMMPFDDYLKDEQVKSLRKEYYAGSDKKIRF